MLLANYAWHQVNGVDHSWSVASLKPNDFGLFDMQGNAYEWVYGSDKFSDSPSIPRNVTPDTPNTKAVLETAGRLMRGGSFRHPPSNLRSARRADTRPSDRDNTNGFRPSRSYNLSL